MKKSLPKVGASLLAGRDGTKKLQYEYGDRLLCVRYRYDPESMKRYKTVEIIIEESIWVPNRKRRSLDDLVEVQIHIREYWLRERVKEAGGKWNRENQTWKLPFREVVRLKLEDRIQLR